MAPPLGSAPPSHLRGRLAFDNVADIFVLDLRAGTVRRLTDHPAPEFNPVWSPDGREIAYRSRQDGSDDIFVMNADGSNKRNITSTPTRQEWGPTWSPDGRHIAFNVSREGNRAPLQIRIVQPDGSGGRDLGTGYAEYPAWSPDGSSIAFMSLMPGARGLNPDYDLRIAAVDGTDERSLTQTPSVMEGNPQWSPDGSQIAFMAGPVGGRATAIWLIEADGTQQRAVTQGNAAVPAWSPDGDRIAFLDPDDIDFVTVKPDGHNRVPVGLSGFGPELGFVSWIR